MDTQKRKIETVFVCAFTYYADATLVGEQVIYHSSRPLFPYSHLFHSFFLKKWAIPGLFFFIFLSFLYTIDSKQMFNKNNFLPKTGFEPGTSGIGSDHSTNWATTTASFPQFTVVKIFDKHWLLSGFESQADLWFWKQLLCQLCNKQCPWGPA